MDDLREEAEKCAKDEFCDGCKGQNTMLHHDSACTETCDGFKEEVESIMADWKAEMTNLTEPVEE